MGRLLVTVAYGARRRDLAVRSDVPIADLLGPLAEALATPQPRPGADPSTPAAGPADRPGDGPADRPGGGLGLAPLCGWPLPLDRSLLACGIGHGAVLVLLRDRG